MRARGSLTPGMKDKRPRSSFDGLLVRILLLRCGHLHVSFLDSFLLSYWYLVAQRLLLEFPLLDHFFRSVKRQGLSFLTSGISFIMGLFSVVQSLPGYIKYLILTLLVLQGSAFLVWIYMVRGEVEDDKTRRKFKKMD